MSRYFSAPSLPPTKCEWWWDMGPVLPSIQASDHQPVNTGLVDKHGNPIMRAPEPCGFHRARGQ